MLEVVNLSKEFAEKKAVDNLSLHLQKGELYGFLGPNGAGKTTTIRILVGLLSPSTGKVMIDGIDLFRQPLLAKKLIGFVPDKPLVYDKLTGREYVRFLAELYGMDASYTERANQWYQIFDLKDAVDSLISTYSHGMKQKISLIGQLIHKPRILFLDEPTVGLDPKGARALHNVLQGLCAEGCTVLISTHLLLVAELMCSRVGIMDRGKLIAEGTVSELKETYHTDSTLEDLFLRLTEVAREADET